MQCVWYERKKCSVNHCKLLWDCRPWCHRYTKHIPVAFFMNYILKFNYTLVISSASRKISVILLYHRLWDASFSATTHLTLEDGHLPSSSAVPWTPVTWIWWFSSSNCKVTNTTHNHTVLTVVIQVKFEIFTTAGKTGKPLEWMCQTIYSKDIFVPSTLVL